LIYQRFLDKSDSREKSKLNIFVNDEKVEFWDPFRRDKDGPLYSETVPVLNEKGSKIGEFEINAFVIPGKNEYSGDRDESKSRISNDNQGFFIYRENRLIHYGGWLRLYSSEPHFSLLRVELSFDHNLDEAFSLDIKKSNIEINEALTTWMKQKFLPPVRKEAERRYRLVQRNTVRKHMGNAHDPSNRNIAVADPEIEKAEVEILNLDDGSVEITNSSGKTKGRLIITTTPTDEKVYVEPIESIADGLLWQPVLINGNQGVQINQGHDFYRKIYYPIILENKSSSSIIQGLDALLWALGIAELRSINEGTIQYFYEMRFDVSKILRLLVSRLPEPPDK
jgi:hypothetical protein